LLKGVKVTLSSQACESDHFWRFFVAAMVKLQQFVISDKFTIEAEQLFSNCQHRLRQASLYLQHIMMSALHHD